MEWERQRTYDYENGKEAGIEIGKQTGIEIGKEEKAIETVTNMIKKKYPTKEISEITGLTFEKVLELQKQIPAKAYL